MGIQGHNMTRKRWENTREWNTGPTVANTVVKIVLVDIGGLNCCTSFPMALSSCSIENNHFNLNQFWLMWLKFGTHKMYFNSFQLKKLKTQLYSWG